MERINVRLPDSLFAALTGRANEEGRKVSQMVRRILSLELGVSYSEELDEKENPKLKGLS